MIRWVSFKDWYLGVLSFIEMMSGVVMRIRRLWRSVTMVVQHPFSCIQVRNLHHYSIKVRHVLGMAVSHWIMSIVFTEVRRRGVSLTRYETIGWITFFFAML